MPIPDLSTAATLVGDLDLLTVPQMQTLLDQVNPAGYLPYAQAITDQMNLFNLEGVAQNARPKERSRPFELLGGHFRPAAHRQSLG